MLLGRFHTRIVLGVSLVVCFVVFLSLRSNGDVVRVPTNDILVQSLSSKEIGQLARLDTCPLCFGRDMCDELSSGRLEVSRVPYAPEYIDAVVHQVYSKNSVKFWMMPEPPMRSFEQIVSMAV